MHSTTIEAATFVFGIVRKREVIVCGFRGMWITHHFTLSIYFL